MFYSLIDRSSWGEFLDYVSKYIGSKEVEVEIASYDMGDQILEQWTHIDGISYDPEEDTVFVHNKLIDHTIEQPRVMVLGEEGSLLRSITIKNAAGVLDILQFREPLLLKEAHSIWGVI